MKKELIQLIDKEIEQLTVDTKNEVFAINRLIPDYIKDLSLDYDFLIAGGMVTSIFTGKPVNDIDIYPTNKDQYIDFILEVLGNSTIVSVTPRSFMVDHSGQLLNIIYYKIFKDAYDIFNSFDYTVVMGAYDVRDEKFILHKHFLRDNAKREIVFDGNTDYPLASMMRIRKYIDRGYSVKQKTMLAVMLRCMQLNITSYEELESQIGGMYGLDISKLINTDKDFNLDAVINDIVDGIYDIDDGNVLRVHDDYTKKRKTILAHIFKDADIKLYKKGNYVYRKVGDRLIRVRKEIADGIGDKAEELTGNVLLYKFVKPTDEEGVYVSYYKSEFIYKIGEYVEDKKKGLWGGCLNEHERFTHSNKSDRVLIELLVNVDDITDHSKAYMTFTKAKVLREMKGKYTTYEEDPIELPI